MRAVEEYIEELRGDRSVWLSYRLEDPTLRSIIDSQLKSTEAALQNVKSILRYNVVIPGDMGGGIIPDDLSFPKDDNIHKATPSLNTIKNKL